VAERTSGADSSVSKKTAAGYGLDSLMISEVEILGVLPKEKEMLKQKFHLEFKEKISRKELDKIIDNIYGTQAYDYVTYELLGCCDPYRLVLNCKQGPIHQFGLGVRADTEEIVSVLLNVGLNAHKMYGHSFDFTGRISTNPSHNIRWSYDAPKMPTLNLAASVRWTDLGLLNLWDNRLSLGYLNTKQEIYLSNIKWKLFDMRVGARNQYISIRNVKSSEFIGDYDFGQLDNDFITVDLAVTYKTSDDLSVYVKAYNLFNEAYTDYVGAINGTYISPAQSRRFIIGAEYNF
jgi:hypothetical protein